MDHYIILCELVVSVIFVQWLSCVMDVLNLRGAGELRQKSLCDSVEKWLNHEHKTKYRPIVLRCFPWSIQVPKFFSLLFLYINSLNVSQTQLEGLGKSSIVHFNGSPKPVSEYELWQVLNTPGKQAENPKDEVSFSEPTWLILILKRCPLYSRSVKISSILCHDSRGTAL